MALKPFSTKTLFSVVTFTEENSIEVIPTKWIYSNWKKCKCPADLKTFSKLRSKPESERQKSWVPYAIEVKCQTDEYMSAQNQAQHLQFTSNIESSDSGTEGLQARKKRKTKPTQKYQNSNNSFKSSKKPAPIQDDGSSEDDEEALHIAMETPTNLAPLYKQPSQLNHVISDPEETSRSSSENYSQNSIASASTGTPSPFLVTDLQAELRRFQEVVLTELHTIKSDVEIVRSAVVRNNSRQNPECPFHRPLSNNADLQAAEESLKDSKDIFKNWCVSLGGTSAESHTRRILGKLFKHEYSLEFNFTGKRGKQSFSKLVMCEVVTSAVLESHRTTECAVEEVISKWFRYGRDRNGGRSKR
ncbi:unnamed protein product [Allacma fusca]|uniref:DUF4806 domain-containing protein n=1 Tax=Allacma fusca TaxID=39272 RepID=A0A8J2Q3B9_9HEXA|nr:unnamed protein product [Allacma fusca]